MKHDLEAGMFELDRDERRAIDSPLSMTWPMDQAVELGAEIAQAISRTRFTINSRKSSPESVSCAMMSSSLGRLSLLKNMNTELEPYLLPSELDFARLLEDKATGFGD